MTDPNAVLSDLKVLVVDDEVDIIHTIREVLQDSSIDEATTFDEAQSKLEHETYDVVILDIMGVDGYQLLDIANSKGVPTLMLTAHAFSTRDFSKSLAKGAHAYIPKEKISDIGQYIVDVLEADKKGLGRIGKWFQRLEPFFEERFGYYWKEKVKEDPEFWRDVY